MRANYAFGCCPVKVSCYDNPNKGFHNWKDHPHLNNSCDVLPNTLFLLDLDLPRLIVYYISRSDDCESFDDTHSILLLPAMLALQLLQKTPIH